MDADSGASELLDVVIVGGGAAGTLVATHLLRAQGSAIRMAIVEPAAPVLGAAYSTPYREHLLNVVAGRMSAFDDDPEHFVRFLQQDGDLSTDPSLRFAPRREYGRYLRATLEAQPGHEHVRWLRERATDVEVGASGLCVLLGNGQRLATRWVVLALGNTPKRPPVAIDGGQQSVKWSDAWNYAAIGRIAAAEDVAILGSGLSMVDVVVSLAKAGHQGMIHVVSRHGLMPLPHATPGPHADDASELRGIDLRSRVRLLRTWADQAQAEGRPWQWVMDRLRLHGSMLWQSLEDVDQRRFLRHAVRYWDIHRHRIAPEIHERIEGLRRRGQLQVHAGRVEDIRADAHIHLRLRLRGDRRLPLRVDRLVNATGVETSAERSSNALVRRLLSRGLIGPGRHRIGIATDAQGRVVDREGQVLPNVLTLGSARIGQLWESIAVPELRTQAEGVARIVVADRA